MDCNPSCRTAALRKKFPESYSSAARIACIRFERKYTLKKQRKCNIPKRSWMWKLFHSWNRMFQYFKTLCLTCEINFSFNVKTLNILCIKNVVKPWPFNGHELYVRDLRSRCIINIIISTDMTFENSASISFKKSIPRCDKQSCKRDILGILLKIMRWNMWT